MLNVTIAGGLLWLLGALACLADDGPSPENVVVVANARDEHSLEIARYYLEKRGIPEDNLFLVETSTGEVIDWPTFVNEIYNPLKRQLIEKEWLEAIIKDEFDSLGRQESLLFSNRIDFLVGCRLPLKIRGTDRLKPGDQGYVQTDRASVDSELCLLPSQGLPSKGFVQNFFHGKEDPSTFDTRRIVRVFRLDGPRPSVIKELLDDTLVAESRGLRGRGYIDLGGPDKKGDAWLSNTGKVIEALHYPVDYNRGEGTYGWGARLDAPALYFGWYRAFIGGAFADERFRFPKGAIGLHIHSYSAAELRKKTQ